MDAIADYYDVHYLMSEIRKSLFLTWHIVPCNRKTVT